MITLSVIAIGIFSAFMLYDLKRVMTAARRTTSPPRWRSTSSVYNVFQNLLALLGIFGGERD